MGRYKDKRLKNSSIVKYADVSMINIHRIHRMAWVIGVINIMHIIFFWLKKPNNSTSTEVNLWYELIIYTHALMLIAITVIGLLAYYIEKHQKQDHISASVLQWGSIFVALCFGTALCVIDQLVTSNINPLLVACIGVGAIFLIPPVTAIIAYLMTFVVFNYFLPFTQPSTEMLVHLRVNSITVVGLGLGISLLLWRQHMFHRKQNQIIYEQRLKLEQKNKHLEYLAHHDSLTGLYNRSYFIEWAEAEVKRNHRNGRESCVVLMDIDYFKHINDEFGHPAGDKVLQDLANIITSTIRSSDLSARLGGEEFIILLPETALYDGKEVVYKLRKRIKDYPFEYDGVPIQITVSMGLTMLGESFNNAYIRVDNALYSAKKNGRDSVVIAERDER